MVTYNTTMWKIIGHRQLLAFFEHVRSSGHLGHAYLFTGPAQIGKRTLALAFAQTILCTGQHANPVGSPCGSCHACLKVQSTTHPDLSIIRSSESKKALSIDTIREVLRASTLQPQEGRYSIFLLPNAESLSLEAANALLKTLEEPAPQTILLLTTTNEQLLPGTIVSRCQVLPMMLVNTGEIRDALVRQWNLDQDYAQTISNLSAGRPGWAIAASQNPELQEQRGAWLQIMKTLCESGPTQRIKIAAKLAHDTEPLEELLTVWLIWWREMLLASEGYTSPGNPDAIRIHRYSSQIQPAVARQVVEQIQEALRQLEQNANPRLVIEALLLELPQFKQGTEMRSR
jgi:DNA polymerase-3 subunit delta'